VGDGADVDYRRRARGYSWPPFKKENQLARRHGGYGLLGIGERPARSSACTFTPAGEI
jgi:hypothetical protein